MKKIHLLLSILILIFSFSFNSCERIVIDDISDYKLFYESEKLYENDNLLFPNTLNNVKEIVDFKYSYNTITFACNQAYLDVIYEEEVFQQEIKYWDEFEYSDNVVTGSKLKKDDAYLFNYPTYVAFYRRNKYHYLTIIEEQNRIIYILLEPNDYNTTDIPEDFLPKNFFQNLMSDKDSTIKSDGYYFNVAGKTNSWYE